MSINKKLLKKELGQILDFWQNNIVINNSMVREVFIDGTSNNNAALGSMFISRTIYGITAASQTLNSNAFMPLADQAFNMLQSEYKNPCGGYYWALDHNNKPIHDVENNNLGQAFILYGLAEYAKLKNTPEAHLALSTQTQFILTTLKDNSQGGFFDGFDENWKAIEKQNKALGTHLHLLEAFVKVFELNKESYIATEIESLIRIIIDKFIDADTLNCMHRLSPNWEALPNEIWAGHNAEVSWILCNSAKTIQNKTLIEQSKTHALKTMDKLLEQAYDAKNKGLFNVIENKKPIENIKIWWPQAEMTIALLNCYEITKQDKYMDLACEFSAYISENLISKSGEWYSEIAVDGSPINTAPLVFFWKSLYHNVRYYVEVLERIAKLELEAT